MIYFFLHALSSQDMDWIGDSTFWKKKRVTNKCLSLYYDQFIFYFVDDVERRK